MCGCVTTELDSEGISQLLKKGKPNAQVPYKMAEIATQMQVYGVWHAGNDYCGW